MSILNLKKKTHSLLPGFIRRNLQLSVAFQSSLFQIHMNRSGTETGMKGTVNRTSYQGFSYSSELKNK